MKAVDDIKITNKQAKAILDMLAEKAGLDDFHLWGGCLSDGFYLIEASITVHAENTINGTVFVYAGNDVHANIMHANIISLPLDQTNSRCMLHAMLEKSKMWK